MNKQNHSLALYLLVLFIFPASISCFSQAGLNMPVSTETASQDNDTNISICNNQLPYSWNGLNCVAAGNYSVTLNGSNGMDSVVILHLSVLPVGTSIKNVSICSGNVPYHWNGNTYSTGGTYPITLTGSNGCDSVAILSLTINSGVTSVTNFEICSDELPYFWNGVSYITSGTYTKILTSNAGCDSIATLNLLVNPVSASLTHVIICSTDFPYYWNGNSYAAAGTYQVILTNYRGCDSTAKLTLESMPVSASTITVNICTIQLPYSWNGNTYTAGGTYQVHLTNTKGCDSVATLILNASSSLSSTHYHTICESQLPYTWNGHDYYTNGVYSVTLTSVAGCDSIATLHLITVPLLTSNTSHSVCVNQLPYTWNGNSYSAEGNYSVMLTSLAGCDSVANLSLNVYMPSVVTDTIALCEKQLPYDWYGHIIAAPGTYFIDPPVSINNCVTVDTLVVNLRTIVPSNTNVSVCNNQLPYNWNGNPYSVTGTYSVTLVASSGCDSIANLNFIVSNVTTSITTRIICQSQVPYYWNGHYFDSSGTYIRTLTGRSGCDSLATLILQVRAATSNTNLTICTSQVPYSWNGNSYSAGGTYSVSLTGSGGCDSVATLNLTVIPPAASLTNIPICASQLPYAWNGNSYSTGGIYSVTLVSSAGCDSIATLNLTANPIITTTSDITVCSSQLPFSWGGNSYASAGNYSNSYISAAGCDSVATLNLTVIPATTSTTSLTICNNQLPYLWNGNSYPTGGIFTIALNGSNGCDSLATLDLTITDILTSTTNVSLCSNQLPYFWNGNNYSAAGTYSVILTTGHGCDSVPILSLAVASYLTSTTNVRICYNELPYTWNNNIYNSSGTYNVWLTGSGGCDSLASLNLSVNMPEASTTQMHTCSRNLPYSWNGNSYPTAGTYSVVLTGSGGCDSIATLQLIEDPAPESTTDITICTTQLPYSWNGNNYPAAGMYSVTLTSVAGCDSIATLNLITNAVVTSTTTVNTCTNQLPYLWNGNNYSNSGIFTITLTGSNGCDSIATLNLLVNTTGSSITDQTICNNQLPYSWNGNSYPIAGIYSVTLVSSAGCDSIATLNLHVNATATSTTDVTICSSQLPYSWNGNSYPTAGTYPVILVSSAGCDSLATLNLIANAVVTSTTDVTICNNQLPYSWNGNSYPMAGTYSVTLVSSAGCDSIATLNLIANAVITSTTDVTICNSQLPYSWNGNSYPTAGTYSVTLTSNSGCDSIATLNLIVNAVITSATDVTICNSQLPYSWNGNSYPTAGTYSVTLVSSAGCDSLATLNLIANAVATSSTDVIMCNSQLPYSWNGNSYPTAGTYSVTLTSNSGCDSIATLNLIANAVITSTTDVTICNNQLPYSWNGNSYPMAGTYSVTLVSSAGCDSIATLNLIANAVITSTTDVTICNSQLPYSWNGNSYPTAGTYSVTLTSNSGCDSIATLNLIANAVVTSTTDITICSSQLPYSWNGNSYPTAGTYPVTLVSSAGCDSIATLNLIANAVITSTTDVTICNSQLPYSWNGNSYPTAGTYSVTLTSNSGCDSIATLNLIANAVVTSTTDVTICNSQLPYSWNGNSYPTAGTYSITLMSSAGCDSIATLNLIANAVITSTTDVTICNSQLPYSWNGNSYPTAGTYSITLTSNSGCDSIATLNLIANAVVTSTTDVTICSSQLPYSWNGNSYPTAGTYTVTLTSNIGCDSIATLNLTETAALRSILNINICKSQLPYSWNGNNYFAGGSYSVVLVSIGGCDSTATLNLFVSPVSSGNTDIAICNNALPYHWNGNDYTAAGIYSVSLPNAVGCDSLATLHLSVNNVTYNTVNITVCNNQLPFVWNGQSYSTGGNFSITLPNAAGCDSIVTLILTVNPVITSFTNIAICPSALPYTWNGNNYSATGIYTLTLPASTGCDSIASLNLTVNQVNTSTTIVNTCSNQLPYSWNGAEYNSSGQYIVHLSSSAGCDSIAILELAVHPVVTGSTDQHICSAQLPYHWNGQDYTATGTYNITLTSSSGCDSIATLNLIVNPTPGAPVVVSPLSYCQYETTVPLIATTTIPGASLLWYSSPTSGTGSQTIPVPLSINAGTTSYFVSQLNAECEGARSVIIVTINSKPDLGPDKTLAICYDESANLNTIHNTSITGSWSLNQLPVSNPSSVKTGGIYRFIELNSFGCSDTADLDLKIQPQVFAHAGDDEIAEYNQPYQLSGSGTGQYEWSPANLLNNAFIATPVAVLTADTRFILKVSDEIGCFALDTVKIRVLKGPALYVPSAFTPNNDGLNDIFRPVVVGIKSLEYFRIYNRYGILVFETHEINRGWDGRFRGVPQDIGNFTWSLKATDREGNIKILKGNVVLIR